jgi:hypothetical protein
MTRPRAVPVPEVPGALVVVVVVVSELLRGAVQVLQCSSRAK